MSFIEALEDLQNVTCTENGMQGKVTTKNALVDFNYKVPSLRKAEQDALEMEVTQLINTVDTVTLFRYMFFLRDIRGGMGERRIFREIIRQLALKKSKELEKVLTLIPEYGRWDDLFIFVDTPIEDRVSDYLKDTLEKDFNALNDNSLTLLGKWCPSVNASVRARKLAERIFGVGKEISFGAYRKALSSLRKRLKVVEAQISRQEWSEIKYESVPSKANIKYSDLFMREDKERRTEFLDSLSKGKVKVNSETLYPQDVIAYGRQHSFDALAEGMWKGLKDFGEISNVLVVSDVSGSMNIGIGGDVAAIDASIGLGLYFAERNTGVFKDKLVTFSAKPCIVDFGKLDTLKQKYTKAEGMNWGMNTDIEKVFKLVLNSAIKGKCKQEEIPTILILSDMEFDACVECDNSFEGIAEEFERHGYKLPKVVFWNLNSRTNAIPLTRNDMGVILVSGYSPASIKAVMSGELDPYKALIACINDKRYDAIEMAIKDYI